MTAAYFLAVPALMLAYLTASHRRAKISPTQRRLTLLMFPVASFAVLVGTLVTGRPCLDEDPLATCGVWDPWQAFWFVNGVCGGLCYVAILAFSAVSSRR